MNEHLHVDAVGLRLITEFEGAPRLTARLCEGGRYELSYGCTFHPDGSSVLEGETCTPEYAEVLFRHALTVFENIVKKHVTVPITQNQFNALVSLSYNIGEENFRTSSVLRFTNESRIYDAAAAFGMWIFATKDGYKQALRGLLRRHHAEGCVYLGLDWTEACDDEAIALRRDKPASLPGADSVRYKTPFKDVLAVAQNYPLEATQEAPAIDASEQRPFDLPRFELEVDVALTPTDAELAVQQKSAPPQDELILSTPAAPSATDAKGSPPVSEPPSPPSQAAVPSEPDSNPANKDQPRVSAEAAPATAPPSPPAPPVPLPPKLPDPPIPIGQQTSAVESAKKSEDWSVSAKAMWQSRRFWGLVLVMGGRLWMLKTGSNAVLGAVSDPLVTEMFSGFMVMLIGEIIQHWGERKATRPLR